MSISVFLNGLDFQQIIYDKENEFERLTVDNAETLFGSDTIYIDVKHRINGSSLGDTIPDGLLIDLSDLDNPELYLVEIELQNHDFFKHIFPQITKFFAFFRNSSSRQKLTEQIFSIFKATPPLREKLKELVGTREVYKFLKDMLENSQNILIIIDGPKPEFEEIMNTYTDTWGKMVKVQIVNHFRRDENDILTLEPPFQNLQFGDAVSPPPGKESGDVSQYTEEFHLEGCDANVKDIYEKLKRELLGLKKSLRFNPTKYYIGVVDNRNIAFIQTRKKKIRLTVLLIESEVRSILSSGHNNVVAHSESVQRYWAGNNPNCSVEIQDSAHWDEIRELLEKLVQSQEGK